MPNFRDQDYAHNTRGEQLLPVTGAQWAFIRQMYGMSGDHQLPSVQARKMGCTNATRSVRSPACPRCNHSFLYATVTEPRTWRCELCEHADADWLTRYFKTIAVWERV